MSVRVLRPALLPIRSIAVLALSLGAGCYTYVPVAPTQPEPGASVRAQLSDTGRQAALSQLGPGVTGIDGMLLERADTSLSMLVESYRSTRMGNLSGANEPIRLNLEGITGLEQKRMSPVRTALLGVAFLGGAVLATNIFAGDERVVEREDPEDPGPFELVAPVLRIVRMLTR